MPTTVLNWNAEVDRLLLPSLDRLIEQLGLFLLLVKPLGLSLLLQVKSLGLFILLIGFIYDRRWMKLILYSSLMMHDELVLEEIIVGTLEVQDQCFHY